MKQPHEVPDLDLLQEIHRLCCDFENRWQANERPRIEDFINRCDVASARGYLALSLLRSELELRTDLGELPNRNEYHQRLPEFTELVDDAFEDAIDETIDTGEHAKSLGFAKTFRIAHYSILNEIDRGGMGVVYRAFDEKLHRVVALKVILSGHLASAAEIQRFEIESRAVSMLDHPGIVPVFDVGEWAGHRYLVMPLVEGSNLGDVLENDHPSARRSAEIIMQIAESVQFAHDAGIIHRDLKPRNILLDDSGRTRITDFGLAKIVTLRKSTFDQATGINVTNRQATATGQILGTPNYMPPEQAASRPDDVGPWSDVYALGAVLYEMLAGRPPFQANSVLDCLHKIQFSTPVSPRLVRPDAPRDLTTICLKCLEKDPRRRYATAEGLRDDLERFLKGRPILARPIGPFGKTLRWSQRNPMIAGLLASIVLLVSSAFVSLTLMNLRIREQTRETESALQRVRVATAQRETALFHSRINERLARRRSYAAKMTLAGNAWSSGEISRAATLLQSVVPSANDEDFRGFEWNFLNSQLFGNRQSGIHCDGGEISTLAFSPDGHRLVVTGGGLDSGFLEVRDVASAGLIGQLLDSNSIVQTAAFSPDGNRIAYGTGDGTLIIVGAADLHELHRDALKWTFRSLVWSPTGEWIAAGMNDGQLCVWTKLESSETKLQSIERAHGGPILRLYATPDGKRLYSSADWGTENMMTREWDMQNVENDAPREVRAIAGQSVCDRSPAGDRLLCIRWGNVLVTGSKDEQVLVDKPISTGFLVSPRYAPDGKSVLAATRTDRGVMRLDSDTLELQATYPHQISLSALAVNASQGMFASGDVAGNVFVWSLVNKSRQTRFVQDEIVEFTGKLPGDGRIVCGGKFGAKLWNLETGTMEPFVERRNLCAISKDGQLFASLSPDNERDGKLSIEVWKKDDDQTCFEIQSDDLTPTDRIAISPTGKWLAVSSLSQPLKIYSLAGKEAELINEFPGERHDCEFSPDETTLVTAEQYGVVRSCDLQTMKYQPNLSDFQSYWAWAFCVRFSDDGRFVGSGNGSGVVKIWDAHSCQQVAKLNNKPGVVHCLAFFPDGRRVAISDTGGVRLWDFLTGDELLLLPIQDDHVVSLIINEAGDTIVGHSETGDIYVWRANNSD